MEEVILEADEVLEQTNHLPWGRIPGTNSWVKRSDHNQEDDRYLVVWNKDTKSGFELEALFGHSV